MVVFLWLAPVDSNKTLRWKHYRVDLRVSLSVSKPNSTKTPFMSPAGFPRGCEVGVMMEVESSFTDGDFPQDWNACYL